MLIQDWMAKDVLTVDENTSLMRATRIMKENAIRRLPVVSHGKLIGIVTDRDVKDEIEGLVSETDVLRGFIHSTGIKDGAIQYVLDLEDVPGSVTKVVQTLRDHHARVISVLTSFEDGAAGLKRVAIRIIALEGCDCEDLTRELKKQFTVVYHGMDELKK